jgi:hypothetical protein
MEDGILKSHMARRNTQEGTRTQVRSMRPTHSVIGLVIVCVVIMIGAIYLGKSDDGQIDVNSAIENSNQMRRDAGGDASGDIETVPEVFRNKTNGGLVPQEGTPEPAQAPINNEVISGTTEATSSDISATSSEQIVTE